MLPAEAPFEPRLARQPLRPLSPDTVCRVRVAAALAIVALAAAGCGGDDEESESAPVASSELTITADPDGPGGEPPAEALLTCPGAAAPPAACEALDDLPDDPAAPVPADTPCTEIYGGPDVVTITGTLEGEEIDTELTRENGCEIERFDRFIPLLEVLFPEYQPGEAIGA